MPEAVIFDLDGVLLDSEQRWNVIKRKVTEEAGGRWREEAPHAMMGMSSPEWSAYIRDELGVPMVIDDFLRLSGLPRRRRRGRRREAARPERRAST